MSSKVLSLVGLKQSLHRQNPSEAKEFLDNVCGFFDEDLSKPELEFALEILFHPDNGTIGFLDRSIKERKTFSSSNVIIFDLWIKLLQNHGKTVKFDPYIDSIIQTCRKFIISTLVTAKEKEYSTIVLQELFQNNLMENIDIPELIEKLLEVFNLKNRPSTFLQQVYKLFGIISKNSPEHVSERHALLIRDSFFKTLEDTLLNEETIHFNSLTGAMEGMNMFLENFPPVSNEEPQIFQRLYTCIKKLSDPGDIKQKATFRASLDLFTKHFSLFSEQIFKDYNYWHSCLSKWIKSNVYIDRKYGLYAMHSFHSVLSEQIIMRKNENDKNILKFFMNYFRTILESPASRPYESRIAIRGVGLLSGPCKNLLPEMIQEIISLVIQRTELISIVEDNELRDTLEHFPDYVQALSQMILQMKNENSVPILSQNIQNIIIRLMKDFHYLSKAHTFLVVNSLCNAFFNLSEVNGLLLDEILEKVILQTVIWTCSHKLTYEANFDWQTNIDWKDNITYKSYLPLWEGLLEESGHFSYDKPFVAQKIFNYLIITLFKILDKLNLQTRRRVFSDEAGNDQEFYFCDPNIDLCPVRPHDFYIFINIVDFYRDLFKVNYRKTNFQQWINEFCFKMMNYFIKNPLISGFLKLLEIGLIEADKLNYFTETIFKSETENLRNQLSYFLKNIIGKCQRTSGELQIVSLELILRYPTQFYQEYIIDLIPIFELALNLGKSMLWLAKLAITDLEKISENFSESSNDLRKFYKKIFPLLDTFLQSKGFIEDYSVDIVSHRNKRKIRKHTIQKIGETDLLKLQKRIIAFLGKIDPQNVVLLVPNQTKQNLVKWDVNQNIYIPLHFGDMQPKIYIDTIMPRICDLALTSSDRKTKIAACELVHAVILYLLGTGHHNGKIWKELCTRMVILGSDGDSTVQEMFEPLLMQIMHFMSKYENLNKGVDILIEALMEGISNNDDCSIRDLSARCLREFVEWCIKHTTPEQLAASPVSIEMILNQLKVYSFDSDISKRNGAALAFNNLYRILREQETICDVYFIELLYTFCINFKLSEELNTSSIGTLNSDLEQTSMSLDHIVRVLKERDYLFKESNTKRQIPSSMNQGTLKDIILFLLKETNSKLMNYRHKCVEMIEKLVVHVENVSSLSQFFQKFTNKEMLNDICEGESTGLIIGIKTRPNLNHIKTTKGLPHVQIYNWLEHFLASLDSYCWLLNDYSLPKPEILFDNDIKIFDVIIYYLNNICWDSMNSIIEKIDSNVLNETSDSILRIGTEELNKIESIKCIIIVRIIDFLGNMLKSGCTLKFPKDFWFNIKNVLIKLIYQIIFESHILDFDFRSEEILQKLPQRIENFLKNFRLYSSNKEFLQELNIKIIRKCCEQLKNLTDSAEEILHSERINEIQLNNVRGIIFTCKHIKEFQADDMTKIFLKISAKKLFDDLFHGIKIKIFNKNMAHNLPNDIKKFANQLMKICFIIDDMTAYAINYLLDSTELHITGATKIKHGEHFFNIYKNTIFEQCNENFMENSLKILFNKLTENNFHQIIRIITELTEFMYKYRRGDINCLKKLVDNILLHISILLNNIQDQGSDLLFVELMSHLAITSPYELYEFKKKAPILETWILDRLTNEKNNLEHKSRILILLPLIISSTDVNNELITKSLENVQRRHFPIRSIEFAKNSLEETSLKSVFKSLLHSMIVSKSIVILEFLIKCTAPDQNHILEWMIKDELKIFMKNISNINQQIDCLNKIFNILSDMSLEPNIRQVILQRFLIISIQNSKEETIIKFYTEKIKIINDLIETNYSIGKSGWNVEQALINRIIGYSLIEIMFGCLSKEILINPNCTITKALIDNIKTGTELIGTLTKKAFYTRKEVFVTDDQNTEELYRIYQCSAYRAVCSLVCNTQKKLQFYSKFIFEEDTNKNEFIWQKLINCRNNNLYEFLGQEHENYPKIKDKFVSIRKLNIRQNMIGERQRVTSKQLQTQNVFGSSLSQDMTKIDLNYSIVRTDAEVLSRMENIEQTNVAVNLERHLINQHEIMPTLCGVIQYMYDNEITPITNDPTLKRSYPWITSIAAAMENDRNHKNIRIFLAQLIDNCKNVFEHYCHILFRPILQVLVDECAGNHLNFFVTDLIALLLSWTSKKLYTPSTNEEIRLSSLLLKFLMKNSWHEKREIFKFNLELISTMINLWKTIIIIPSQLLLDLIMKTQKSDSRENEGGIILNAIIFENDLVPWTVTTKINFIKAIFGNFNNNIVTIYQSASHVMGMILNRLNLDNDQENLESLLTELIQKVKIFSNKDEKKFRIILHGVHKYYPEIIDSFREILSFKIPTAYGDIKRMYLEIFLSRLEAYESTGIYNIIISIGIQDLLKNIEYQLLGLHIINRSLPKMSEDDIINLFPNIELCSESRKHECRDVVYEILIYIAKNFKTNLGTKSGLLLLKGLMDSDTEIQKRIFQFWSQEANLPQKIDERILTLITDYCTNYEKQFLGFCTQLILEPAIQNVDSKRQIFQFETDNDAKLLEYNINTNSKIRSNYSLPPLFAATQNFRHTLLTGSQMSDFVRATGEENFFAPTQDPATLTQAKQNFTLSTSSLLPFGAQEQVLNRRSEKVKSSTIKENRDVSLDNLRKRFLRDTEREHRDRALKVIDIRKSKNILENKKKHGTVTLYRRYRFGDYPDLLINSLALLLPLQGLVRRDPIIARQIFVSMFCAILEELGPNSRMFITSISNKIESILENAKTCEPITFATFLEIALLKPEQFNFSPEIISMISKGSNMLTIGVIYLENRLNAEWETDQLSSKSTSTIPIDEQHWLYLSDIYNSLAEYDIVAAIFADKIKTDPRLAKAIELKSNGNYHEAQSLLLEIIDRRVWIEHYYAYICYYECFLEMGSWSELSSSIQQQIDDNEELWTDDYNMNFLLPNLMQAELQQILQGYSRSEDFVRILELWMLDPIKSEHIKTTFCEELMMLHIANRDFRPARVYCENYLKSFLIEWGLTSSLNNKLRLKNLLNAQKVAEVDQYAILLLESFNETSISKLQKRWSKCRIDRSDSLRFWNNVIAYRTYIAVLIMNTLENHGDEDTLIQLRDNVYDMDLQFLDAAIYQKNHELTKKIIERISPLKDYHVDNKYLKYDIAMVKQTILEGDKKQNQYKYEILEQAWIHSNRILNDDNLKANLNLHLEVLDLYSKIGENIFEIIPNFRITNEMHKNLFKYTNQSNSNDIIERIFEQTLWSLKQSTELIDTISLDSDFSIRSIHNIANVYYRLAQFCYDYYDHNKLKKNSIEIEKLLIKSLFEAMKYNCKEAQQLFACVLQLPSIENGRLDNDFKEYSLKVPEWMFLAWIPQILSRLNFKKSCYLDDIIKRIAIIYPNAMIYPFNVWFDKYSSNDNQIIRTEISEILNLIRNPIMDKFIESCKTFCLPEILLTTYLDELWRKLLHTNLQQTDFINEINHILNKVFTNNLNIQGNGFRKIRKYKEVLENLKQNNIIDDIQKIRKICGQIKSSLRQSVGKTDREIALETICPWLAQFHWCGEEIILELPGQYTGNKRPNVLDHIKIVKFGHKIEVFQSQRCPIRITIFGSNAKNYDFLIKYGEDLKQDQRIQQIFNLMSTKLYDDQNCRNHNLFIRTYKVIPINEYCGMLSWVPNTIALKNFIIDCLLRREPNGRDICNETIRTYANFIRNPTKDRPNIRELDIYGAAASYYTRDNLIANFRNLENAINPEILKFALADISVSPESFFVLRNNFATSLATMNIAHWILGIGDRHLLNILTSTTDCSLTGIDFGCTFGSGTRDLPIPEMIPFRLTPHLVNAMNPMGTSGIIFKCMSHTLRVFRQSQRVLMALMEVFVREPTVNWLSNTKINRYEDESDDSSASSNWEPKDRIDIAKCKLLGHNPMHLFQRELKVGIISRNSEFMEGYIRILRGHEQFNIRARLQEENLSVEEQVKCLIDLATDPAILGITYQGFLPWM